jgi:hypothetical protein
VKARYVLASACGSTAAGTAGSGACAASNTVNAVIFPTAPVITAAANSCYPAFNLPTVTAVSGFTVQYSIDGGTYASSPTLPSTPGCHSVQARYVLTSACGTAAAGSSGSGACGASNAVQMVQFPAAPVISAPANVCNAAFSLPTVTDQTSNGFTTQYSIDGGAYSSSPTIPTSAGCHTVQAQYVLTAACGSTAAGTASPGSCSSSNTVSVVIFPAGPVISNSTSTCQSSFSLPSLPAISGFTIEYSLDGGSFVAAASVPTTPGCHTVQARYVLAANCGSTTTGTAGSGACAAGNTENIVIFPTAPSAPVVNSGCGPIVVTPPASVSGFNIEYSFDDGMTWGANTPPTADNCSGYHIRTRYVTASNCGSIAAGTASTDAACAQSPATIRAINQSSPALSGVPANVSVDCGSVPSPPTVTATDPCNGQPLTVVYSSSTTPGSCAGNYVITRTWTATNLCGTSTVATQVITVTDVTGPVLTGVPGTANVSCTSVPAPANVTATDNCSAIPLGVVLTTTTVQGPCAGNYTLTRTWTATDECGNSTSASQVINVIDNVAPVITCPSAQTFCEVAGNNFTIPQVTATDNCTAVANLTFTYQITGATSRNGTGTDASGLFNPGLSTITWTVNDGCGNASTCAANVTITVTPTATISYPAGPYCTDNGTLQNPTLTGTGAYTGGTYSSVPAGLSINPTTGAITPNASAVGTYNVTYTIPASGGCPAVPSNTVVITITSPPTVSIAYAGTPFCNNVATEQPVTIAGSGSYLGGTFSSTAGLVLNASTGGITPLGSTPGTYTVTYTTVANGGCTPVVTTTSITITAAPTITSFQYAGTPFCTSVSAPQTFTMTGTGNYTPGTFSASPSGLFINSSSGAITPSLSAAGTYTVTYTSTPAAGCGSVVANTTVVITQAPSATISYGTGIICPSASSALVTITGTTGGTFSSTAGLTINSVTGTITPNTSTPGTYVVTYFIAAANGCASFSTTTSVTLTDTGTPVLTVPPVANIECNESTLPSNTGQATAVDNCNVPTITYSDVTVNGNCVNRFTITRTWTATDAYGNTSTGTQIINVDDTTPPGITCPPDLTVQTPSDIPDVDLSQVSVSDNCSGTVTKDILSETYVDLFEEGGFCPSAAIRTYQATDACGNTATCTQTITVTDLTDCGECQDQVPYYPVDLSSSPTATDTIFHAIRKGLCCASAYPDRCISFNILFHPGAIGVDIYIDAGAAPAPHEWRIDCQNVEIDGRTICLPEGTGNFFTFTFCKPGNNPEDYTFVSVPGLLIPDIITTRIGCSKDITVSGVIESTVVFTDVTPGGSQGVLTPMTGSLTATFTPGPLSPPIVKYLVCGEVEASVCDAGTACDTVIIYALQPVEVSAAVPLYNCLNNPPLVQATALPTDLSYQYEWYNAFNGGGTLLSSGTSSSYAVSSAGNYSVIAIDITTGLPCNRDTANFTVTFDVSAPVVTAPANLTLQCNNPNNATLISNWLASATAVDASNPSIQLPVTNNYVPFTHICGGIDTVTFSAADSCGNIGTATSLIIIIDTSVPNINCPPQVSVSCSSNVPAAATDYATFVAAGGTASDLCDSSLAILWLGDVPSNITCPNNFNITRTYRATDDCGNSATCTQLIIVNNTAAPVAPANGGSTVQCIAQATVPTPPIVYDACGSTITPTMVVGSDPACEGTKVYTFTYTTCSGLSAVWTYTYIIDRTTPPVVPANGSSIVACPNATDVAPTPPTVFDVCGITITPTGPVVSAKPACEGTRTYTYTYADCSGLSTTWLYTYTVEYLPFTDPVDGGMTVQCRSQADVPPSSNVLPVVLDNCGNTLTPSPPIVSPRPGCNGTRTYTYTYNDCEGNVQTFVFTYTVNDNTAPVINCPNNVTVQCIGAVPSIITNYNNFIAAGGTITDNCGILQSSFTSSQVQSGTCPRIITRTYSIQDSCGNVNQCVQTITVDDITDPVIACPANLTFECMGDVPPALATYSEFLGTGGTVSDNCGIDTTSYTVTESDSGTCPRVITRTYSIADSCGNIGLCAQTITVNDITDPLISCPTDLSFECMSDIPVAFTLYSEFIAGGGSASDNCGLDTTTFSLVEGESGTCPRIFTMT